MYLRKAQAGSAPGHIWNHDGQVLEVEDELAHKLLAIPDGGFSEALPDPDPEPETDQEEEPSDEETPKRKGGRPRLPRDEHGNIIRTEINE